MKQKETRGLLAIWAGIDERYLVEYRKWHNLEHMEERVTIPGFYVGRRYQGTCAEPYFLMMYETVEAEVLRSEPYLHALNNSTPWTREALAQFKDPIRAIYSLICTVGKEPATDAPYIMIVKFDCDLESGTDLFNLYKGEYLPKMCAVQGIFRGRLYEVDLEVSNIKTNERKIHGAGPGRERFLALFEMASLDVTSSEAWKEAQMPDDQNSIERLGKLENMSQELFWLDFMMYAPE